MRFTSGVMTPIGESRIKLLAIQLNITEDQAMEICFEVGISSLSQIYNTGWDQGTITKKQIDALANDVRQR